MDVARSWRARGIEPSSGQPPLVEINAWNGRITLGLVVPNYVVVLAAGVIACVLWLRAFSIWNSAGVLSIWLSLYGLLQSGFWFLGSILASSGTPGIGSLLTLVSFGAVLVGLVREVTSELALGGQFLSAFYGVERPVMPVALVDWLLVNGWGVLAVVAGVYVAAAARSFNGYQTEWATPAFVAWTGLLTGPLAALAWHYRGQRRAKAVALLAVAMFVSVNVVLWGLTNVEGFERLELVWSRHKGPLFLWLSAWFYGPVIAIIALAAPERRTAASARE